MRLNPRGRRTRRRTSNTANLRRSRHPLAFKPKYFSRKSAVTGVTVKLPGRRAGRPFWKIPRFLLQ